MYCGYQYPSTQNSDSRDSETGLVRPTFTSFRAPDVTGLMTSLLVSDSSRTLVIFNKNEENMYSWG